MDRARPKWMRWITFLPLYRVLMIAIDRSSRSIPRSRRNDENTIDNRAFAAPSAVPLAQAPGHRAARRRACADGSGLAQADVITSVNGALLNIVRSTSASLIDGPPEVAREIAMIDGSMFNAVSAASSKSYAAIALLAGPSRAPRPTPRPCRRQSQ